MWLVELHKIKFQIKLGYISINTFHKYLEGEEGFYDCSEDQKLAWLRSYFEIFKAEKPELYEKFLAIKTIKE